MNKCKNQLAISLRVESFKLFRVFTFDQIVYWNGASFKKIICFKKCKYFECPKIQSRWRCSNLSIVLKSFRPIFSSCWLFLAAFHYSNLKITFNGTKDHLKRSTSNKRIQKHHQLLRTPQFIRAIWRNKVANYNKNTLHRCSFCSLLMFVQHNHLMFRVADWWHVPYTLSAHFFHTLTLHSFDKCMLLPKPLSLSLSLSHGVASSGIM